MNRACITEAINALETACEYILENVQPGIPGKIDAVMGLRHTANRLLYEFATNKEST